MAHLTIQYSPVLESRLDLGILCAQLRAAMVELGFFPIGGIRVRAWPTPHEAIADGHTDNAYADLVVRMGAGRTMEQKRQAGERFMQIAETFFKSELEKPHFALALEIVEVDKDLSWKTNSIHPRLKAEG